MYWAKTGRPYKYVVWGKDIVPTFTEDKWRYYFSEIRKIDKKSTLLIVKDLNAFWDIKANLECKDFNLVYISGDSLEYF